MSKTFRKFLVILLVLTVTMAFSGMSAFADGESGSEAEETVLSVTNNFNMFKPTAAKLIKTESGTILELEYASTSYDKAYAGTSKEAVLTAAEGKLVVRADGKYMIPVDTFGEEFPVAFHSVKNAGWYDRTFKIDTEAKTLTTDNPGTAIVPDTYGNEWDDEISAESSVGMFAIENSKVTIENGEANIVLKAGNNSRSFPKIAFIDQTATDEEKEAKAIIGTQVGDSNSYIYEFSLPVEKLGEALNVSHYQTRNGESEWHNWSEQQTLTFNSASVVNQLIEQIQIQKNDEYTERYIAASKKCWDALSDEDKEKDDGYFSDDTGDASLDDPLNTAPDKDKELLVVSFGTSFNGSRVATIGAVEKALADAYGDEYAVRRAFTAQIIINHVWARDGEVIDNVGQAMDKAVKAGVKEMLVQPTHLMSGAEYDELKEEIDTYADKIDITYGKPLLDSDEDKEAVAKAVVETAVKEAGYATIDAAAADKTAFVFMGHGTSHDANVTYTYMQQTMDSLGYDNCFVGTVEGKPESTALPEVKKAVEAKGYTKVVLRPLMVVAGDHANNDMAANEEGSWYYAFVNGGEFEVEGQDEAVNIGEGFGAENVTCQINGLGEIGAVQQLYVEHAAKAIPGEINVTMTVNNKGTLAEANDGSLMANKKVVVKDLDFDGVFSFDEALSAAHKAYNSRDGYVAGTSSWGGISVSKLWGEDTYNTLFFINHEGITTSVKEDFVKDGDYLVASLNADDAYYADWYTMFEDPAYNPAEGDNVTLTLVGHLGMAYTAEDKENTPIPNVTVKTVDGEVLGTTNGNGRVTFTAPASEITITAEGTVSDEVTDWSTGEQKTVDCPIIAPAYTLKIADKNDPAYQEAVKKAADEAIKAQDEAETAQKAAEAAAAQEKAAKEAAEAAQKKAEEAQKAAEEAKKTAEEKQAAADKAAAEAKAAADKAANTSSDDKAAKEAADKEAAAAKQAQTDAEKALKEAQDALKAAEEKADKAVAAAEKAKTAQLKAEAKNYTVKGLKVSVKKQKFTVKYSKNKKATGYQIQYKLKTAKKWANLKKATTKLKYTSKKLKKGKTYQFRVRTYTKVNGKKVYGKWTKVKSVKCK